MPLFSAPAARYRRACRRARRPVGRRCRTRRRPGRCSRSRRVGAPMVAASRTRGTVARRLALSGAALAGRLATRRQLRARRPDVDARLAVRYDPAGASPPLPDPAANIAPDLCTVLAQAPATLLDATLPATPLTAQTLAFGRQLILRTPAAPNCSSCPPRRARCPSTWPPVSMSKRSRSGARSIEGVEHDHDRVRRTHPLRAAHGPAGHHHQPRASSSSTYGDGQQLVFERRLGEIDNYMWHAVRAFFEEGGRRLYVKRIYRTDDGDDGTATARSGAGASALTVAARYPGRRGQPARDASRSRRARTSCRELRTAPNAGRARPRRERRRPGHDDQPRQSDPSRRRLPRSRKLLHRSSRPAPATWRFDPARPARPPSIDAAPRLDAGRRATCRSSRDGLGRARPRPARYRSSGRRCRSIRSTSSAAPPTRSTRCSTTLSQAALGRRSTSTSARRHGLDVYATLDSATDRHADRACS